MSKRTVSINVGIGPIDNASVGYSRQNISQLILDAGFELDQIGVEKLGDDDKGRFYYKLTHGEKICYIDMPGIDIALVRYLGDKDQDIRDFPRLYVNGSSWLWLFAVKIVKTILQGED